VEDVIAEIECAIRECPEGVSAVLEGLGEKHRTLFCMYFGLCGYRPHSYNAIARSLGMDMGHTRVRVIKAAIFVYRCLEQVQARQLPSYEDERNAFVMGSLHQSEPMLRNFAFRYHADFDELYQAAAEEALGAYKRAISAENPQAYLHKVIRYACLNYLNLTSTKSRKQTLSDHYQIMSLNKPLCIDSEFTLEDVIVQVNQISEEYPEEVYAAVESLPDKYRLSLCMRYGLCEHPPHSFSEMARSLGIPIGTAKTWVYRAVELLRERIAEEVLYG
jgi:RNA polymerase sigma factor (sigma-70 family)